MIEGTNCDRSEAQKAFHIRACTDGLGIAEIGSVCMVVWRREVTSARFRHQQQVLDEVVAHHPGRAGLLCVIEPSAPPPTEPLRKASTDMIASYGERLRCVACVIEGGGFRAAITRSVLSSMSVLLSTKTFDVKFAATVAAAAPWIARLCDGVSPLSVLQAHEQLRLGLSGSAA